MESAFSTVLSELRRSRKISQRQAAQDLNISQALLSHYENGIREPKLEFVVRVCEYYNVSADYLLGRTTVRENPMLTDGADIEVLAGEYGNVREKVMQANHNMRIIFNTLIVIFGLMATQANEKVVKYASTYLNTAAYKVFRCLGMPHSVEELSGLTVPKFEAGPLCDAAMKIAELDLIKEVYNQAMEGMPIDVSDEQIMKNYPTLYSVVKETLCRLDEDTASYYHKHKSNP